MVQLWAAEPMISRVSVISRLSNTDHSVPVAHRDRVIGRTTFYIYKPCLWSWLNIFYLIKAKMSRTIRSNHTTTCTTTPHRHTLGHTLPHTLQPSRGMQPPRPHHHPLSIIQPQGLAPYPHLCAHCHPLLPYYHIWSTTTATPPYSFTLPHAPPARHAPFSMATLREKKRRMKRQGLS